MNGWACQYCGRANPSDRLTCNGCQAPYRHGVARYSEMTYKGRPLSTLTDAEMDEAADAVMNQPLPYYFVSPAGERLPQAFVEALCRRTVP